MIYCINETEDGFCNWVRVYDADTTGMRCVEFLTSWENSADPTSMRSKHKIMMTDSQLSLFVSALVATEK